MPTYAPPQLRGRDLRMRAARSGAPLLRVGERECREGFVGGFGTCPRRGRDRPTAGISPQFEMGYVPPRAARRKPSCSVKALSKKPLGFNTANASTNWQNFGNLG